MNTIDRLNIDYQGNTEPPDAPEASTWFNTDNGRLYMKIGGIWVRQMDSTKREKRAAEEAYDRAMDIL